MSRLLSDRALLDRLVGFDSTSRESNLPLADFICDYVDRPSVRITRNPSADGRKTNLLIRLGPEESQGLTLSGHMDVVPAEEDGWHSDPFTLTEEGERLVGRGAADMKGFLALAMNRLAALDPAALKHPLALLFTYDEEIGTLGARRFTETWSGEVLPRDVIIGEPTSLRVVRLHKGMLRLRLGFEGVAAHSGFPHLGRNAIEPAARAIVALTQLRRTLEAERPPHGEHFPDVPFTALNVGTVHGGSAANVIPDRCTIELGIRLLPETMAETVTALIRETVREAMPQESFSLELVSESPAMMLAPDADIYRALCTLVRQRESLGVAFATDAGWLQRVGFRCVLFGPGSIEVAHRANEFVPVADLSRGAGLLENIVRARCFDS
ncbi:MAG TPA: acetylornithine deacetylase [Gemmatimonadales bacterium]|jgi:acetylornithine deacetylase